VKYQIRDSKRL